MKATIGALFFIAVALATIEVEGGQPKIKIQFKESKQEFKGFKQEFKQDEFKDDFKFTHFKKAQFTQFKKAILKSLASAAAAENKYGSATGPVTEEPTQVIDQRDGAKVSNDDQRDGAKVSNDDLEDLEDLDASPARKERTGSSWIAARLFSFTIFLAAAVTLISWIIQKKKKACYKKASFSEK